MGEIFGESSILLDIPRTVTAKVCSQKLVAKKIPKSYFIKMNKSNKNKLWIYLSLILAMVVDIFVFPESILQWKPLLTLLVLIYWNMALPDKVGILEALFFGLIMDLLKYDKNIFY